MLKSSYGQRSANLLMRHKPVKKMHMRRVLQKKDVINCMNEMAHALYELANRANPKAILSPKNKKSNYYPLQRQVSTIKTGYLIMGQKWCSANHRVRQLISSKGMLGIWPTENAAIHTKRMSKFIDTRSRRSTSMSMHVRQNSINRRFPFTWSSNRPVANNSGNRTVAERHIK